MKAYEVGAQKGLESLRVVDRPAPTAGPGQAVVRIKANSLNYRDVMVLNGWYGPARPETLIPLSDGAGEVVAVGDGITRVKPGDRVAISFFSRWVDGPWGPQYFGSDLGGGANGTLAEMGAFPADALVKLPDAWTFEEGACLPCAGVHGMPSSKLAKPKLAIRFCCWEPAAYRFLAFRSPRRWV